MEMNKSLLLSIAALVTLNCFADQDVYKKRIAQFMPPYPFCESQGELMNGDFLRRSCVTGVPCKNKEYSVKVECFKEANSLYMQISGLPGGVAASKIKMDETYWNEINGSILVARFNILQNSKLRPVILDIQESPTSMIVKYEVYKDNSLMQHGFWTLKRDSYLHQIVNVKETVGFGIVSNNEYSLQGVR